MTADSRKRIHVQVAKRFTASAERVFDAFLDPKQAGQFMFATTNGRMMRAEIDARVGGKFMFVDRREGQDVEHWGEYLEIDRPRRLVFSFTVTGFEQTFDVIAIDIVPAPSGCALTLTHDMNAEFEQYKDRTERGWSTILDNLDRLMSQGSGKE